jgi:hypothetical protein
VKAKPIVSAIPTTKQETAAAPMIGVASRNAKRAAERRDLDAT